MYGHLSRIETFLNQNPFTQNVLQIRVFVECVPFTHDAAIFVLPNSNSSNLR